MNEFDWIALIKGRAGHLPRGWIGIGDDAAVFNTARSKSWVVSTDVIVEGVDFDQSVTAVQVGRKALAVNLSDMAAMGAHPEAFLMTLGVPQKWNGTKLCAMIDGVFRLAKEYRVVCIGGDMSGSDQFFCSMTIFGQAPQRGAVLRTGARPGDIILVTGSLGGSIREKHYAFTPRVNEAEWLAQNHRPSAMLDISDGLTQDLGHLLNSSRCAARLDLEKIPFSRNAKNMQSALSDGEDFELLMTVSPQICDPLKRRWKKKFPKIALSEIGKIIPGRAKINYFKHGQLQNNFQTHSGFKHLQ